MAIYEILIRGAVDGSLVGAHQIDWNEQGVPGLPRPLAVDAVGGVLGAAFATLATDYANLKAKADDYDAATVELAALKEKTADYDAVKAKADAYDAAQAAALATVSRRQFFQAAALSGLITPDEALSAVAGVVVPASIAAAINTLPEDQRFAAQMAVVGSRDFERLNPFVSLLAVSMGKTSAEIDALFTLAASL
ncbi:hypothetical protein GJ654_18900 [Rhodoblastus acidophilus]|uniref:Uncharacterized protein n=1 Tax=Rhodoblastus acidophilus TaxID=1074 RepID=A0A6N8DV45_RHOAC|nr:hypothetical protein [Rhodoblastus acidophilus]MCW2276398.1 hypothetical protein [Rhodoblastus acidophilus]MTV33053.1 hypothetical protein [Rhodoblastus acidophilus]